MKKDKTYRFPSLSRGELNALRRIILQDIKGPAITEVQVDHNTSLYNDEKIVHSLSMVPVNGTGESTINCIGPMLVTSKDIEGDFTSPYEITICELFEGEMLYLTVTSEEGLGRDHSMFRQCMCWLGAEDEVFIESFIRDPDDIMLDALVRMMDILQETQQKDSLKCISTTVPDIVCNGKYKKEHPLRELVHMMEDKQLIKQRIEDIITRIESCFDIL